MKSPLKYIVLLAAICAMYSCGPMGDDVELALTSEDPAQLVYTCERQTVRLKMDCNRSWKASCSEEWIEIDTSKGSEGDAQNFIFILYANPNYSYRTGEIVIKAGDRDLVLTVTQEPEIKYCIKENFDSEDLIIEDDLPQRWKSIDADGDGFGWRCYRDPETEETFAYSYSYHEDLHRILTPDNWMTTPKFVVPSTGFNIRWDVRGSDADYLGDKYQVYVANDGTHLIPLELICEEETTSATQLTHHCVSLDKYVGTPVCIAFRHYESTDLARLLITNVEVSNRR